ncbi:MAG TPA: DUF2254 family protein [Albidovulum sp.]|uniref:DUF2254 domain-containing protein n=1 Tax=Albidovulum sp. TaxID=1872424 RepID=UPI002BC06796|nr:DUF2254 family protein [Albidovulum sp.]
MPTKTRKLLSKSLFRLRRLFRRLWARTWGFALLALAAAALSRVLAPFLPASLTNLADVGAVLNILAVLSSSMLAVTTFSLGVIMSTRLAIISTITPRAHQFVADDPVTQRVLATFMGAFVYALTGQVLLWTGVYEEGASAVLLVVSILVLVLVVVAMLSWIGHLTKVGSIPATVEELEEAMQDAFADWRARPALGARPVARDAPPPGDAATTVAATEAGYVQHVDIGALNDAAEKAGAEVHVTAPPGSFVVPGAPLCHHSGQMDPADIRAAFSIDRTRAFDQDVRFGIIVLSEIAQRALSPAVNDPGTAIFIIDRITAHLVGEGRPETPEPPTCPQVFMPVVTPADLIADGLAPIARDGAEKVEVQDRLQRAFATIASQGDRTLADAARDASRRAASLADEALKLPEDRSRIRAMAAAVQAAGASGM